MWAHFGLILSSILLLTPLSLTKTLLVPFGPPHRIYSDQDTHHSFSVDMGLTTRHYWEFPFSYCPQATDLIKVLIKIQNSLLKDALKSTKWIMFPNGSLFCLLP